MVRRRKALRAHRVSGHTGSWSSHCAQERVAHLISLKLASIRLVRAASGLHRSRAMGGDATGSRATANHEQRWGTASSMQSTPALSPVMRSRSALGPSGTVVSSRHCAVRSSASSSSVARRQERSAKPMAVRSKTEMSRATAGAWAGLLAGAFNHVHAHGGVPSKSAPARRMLAVKYKQCSAHSASSANVSTSASALRATRCKGRLTRRGISLHPHVSADTRNDSISLCSHEHNSTCGEG